MSRPHGVAIGLAIVLTVNGTLGAIRLELGPDAPRGDAEAHAPLAYAGATLARG